MDCISIKQVLLSDVTVSGAIVSTNLSFMKIMFSIDVYFGYTDVMRVEIPPTHQWSAIICRYASTSHKSKTKGSSKLKDNTCLILKMNQSIFYKLKINQSYPTHRLFIYISLDLIYSTTHTKEREREKVMSEQGSVQLDVKDNHVIIPNPPYIHSFIYFVNN